MSLSRPGLPVGHLLRVGRQIPSTSTAARIVAGPSRCSSSSQSARPTSQSKGTVARSSTVGPASASASSLRNGGQRPQPPRSSSPVASSALSAAGRPLGLTRSYAARSTATSAGKRAVPPPPKSGSRSASLGIDLPGLEQVPTTETAMDIDASPALGRLPTVAASKQIDLNDLPLYDYRTYPSGILAEDRPTVLLTSSATLADAVVPHLGTIVGMDIEWAPQFIRGGGTNPTALMQISDGQTILIMQITSWGRDCPPNLRIFLENPEVHKLGVGIQADGKKIRADLGVNCAGLRELSDLMSSPGRSMGLAAYAAQYLHHRLPKVKKVTMSNWAADQLSAAQIAYAANDVQSAVHIYTAMQQAALKLGQMHTKGWAWESPSAQVQIGRSRVPQDLVNEIQANTRVATNTPSSSPPWMTFNKGVARGKSYGAGWAGQKALSRSTAGRGVIDSLTGGRFGR